MKSLSFTLAALLGMLAVAQATDVRNPKNPQNPQNEEQLVVGAAEPNTADVIEASDVSAEELPPANKQ